MSKASQRRLAEEKNRLDTKREQQNPHQHLGSLLLSYHHRFRPDKKWRMLCEDVKCDPPHPDRGRIIKCLENSSLALEPLLRASREFLNEKVYSSDIVIGTTDLVAAVTEIGGRLFTFNKNDEMTAAVWFDPVEESLLYVKPSGKYTVLPIMLKEELTRIREIHLDVTGIGCMFYFHDSGFPAIFFGMSDTGAMATIVNHNNRTYAARSAAVGEMAFNMLICAVKAPFNVTPATQMFLRDMVESMRGVDEPALEDPLGSARHCMHGIRAKVAQSQVNLQNLMSSEIRRLQDEIVQLNKSKSVEEAKLAASASKAEEKARKNYEKRISVLEGQVTVLKASARSAIPPPAASPNSASFTPPAPQATLAQKMGCFFGQS